MPADRQSPLRAARFKIFRSDTDHRPEGEALASFDELSSCLSFERRPNLTYVIQYHHKLYSLSEFKRLVEAGEII